MTILSGLCDRTIRPRGGSHPGRQTPLPVWLHAGRLRPP